MKIDVKTILEVFQTLRLYVVNSQRIKYTIFKIAEKKHFYF